VFDLSKSEYSVTRRNGPSNLKITYESHQTFTTDWGLLLDGKARYKPVRLGRWKRLEYRRRMRSNGDDSSSRREKMRNFRTYSHATDGEICPKTFLVLPGFPWVFILRGFSEMLFCSFLPFVRGRIKVG